MAAPSARATATPPGTGGAARPRRNWGPAGGVALRALLVGLVLVAAEWLAWRLHAEPLRWPDEPSTVIAVVSCLLGLALLGELALRVIEGVLARVIGAAPPLAAGALLLGGLLLGGLALARLDPTGRFPQPAQVALAVALVIAGLLSRRLVPLRARVPALPGVAACVLLAAACSVGLATVGGLSLRVFSRVTNGPFAAARGVLVAGRNVLLGDPEQRLLQQEQALPVDAVLDVSGHGRLAATLDELRALIDALQREYPDLFDLGDAAQGWPDFHEPTEVDLAVSLFGKQVARLEATLDRVRQGERPASGAETLVQRETLEGAGGRYEVLVDGYVVQASSLTLVNAGDVDVVAPRVFRDADVAFHDLPSLVAQVVGDAQGERERAERLWAFMVSGRQHATPATEAGWLHDPVELLGVWGYGFCDDAAEAYVQLARAAGLEARLWVLEGHLVPEVRYAGGWHLYDPDGEVWFRGPDGDAASVEELIADPGLFDAPVLVEGRDAPQYPRGVLEPLFTSVDDNSLRPVGPLLLPRTLDLVLRPGERVRFDLEPGTARFTDGHWGPPGQVCNGRWSLDGRLPAEGPLAFALPFPLLDGRCRVELGAARAGALRLELTLGSGAVHELSPSGVDEAGRTVFALGGILPNGGGQPERALALRLLDDDGPLADSAVEVELVFQHAARWVPRLEPGSNGMRWSQSSPAARLLVEHRYHVGGERPPTAPGPLASPLDRQLAWLRDGIIGLRETRPGLFAERPLERARLADGDPALRVAREANLLEQSVLTIRVQDGDPQALAGGRRVYSPDDTFLEPTLVPAALASDLPTHELDVSLDGTGTARVDLPDGVLETLELEFVNTGPVAVRNPRLTVDGRGDLYDIGAVLAAALGPEPGPPAARAHKLWAFLSQQLYHADPASEGPECHDPVRLLNAYGYGFCDDGAIVLGQLAQAAGLTARIWALRGHVLAELFHDDGWHAYDVDGGVVYPGEDGLPASVEQLVATPTLLGSPRLAPGRTRPFYDEAWVRERVTTTDNNRVAHYDSAGEPHVMRWMLLPGDALRLRWDDPRRRVVGAFPASPGRVGSGEYRSSDAPATLPWERAVELPWPIVGGALVVHGDAGLSLRVRGAGIDQLVQPVRTADGRLVFGLDAALSTRDADAVYGLSLELVGEQPPRSLELQLDLQVAPSSLPALAPGSHTLRWDPEALAGSSLHARWRYRVEPPD